MGDDTEVLVNQRMILGNQDTIKTKKRTARRCGGQVNPGDGPFPLQPMQAWREKEITQYQYSGQN